MFLITVYLIICYIFLPLADNTAAIVGGIIGGVLFLLIVVVVITIAIVGVSGDQCSECTVVSQKRAHGQCILLDDGRWGGGLKQYNAIILYVYLLFSRYTSAGGLHG